MENNNVKAALAAKETKKKIEALSGVVADFESLADAYTASEDLKNCRFHFHTPPMGVDIGKLDFFEDLSEEEKGYVRRAGSSMSFKFFIEEQKKLKSISEGVRKYLQKCSVGNSSFVSKESFYNDFLPYLKGKEIELEELKAQMEAFYEDEIKSFRDNVLSVVDKMCPCRHAAAEKAVSYITDRPAEAFLAGISFDLETEFGLEGVSDSADLSDLLERSKRAYVSRQIEAVYVGQLQELWGGLATYIAGITPAPDSLEGYNSTRSALCKKAEKVEKENIGGIPVISALTQSIKELSEELIKDLAEQEAFEIASEIIGRGSEFGASFRFLKGLPEWCNREDLLENYSG